MVSEGLAYLMHGELMRPQEKEKMLILSGDAQPLDVLGMHALAGEILAAFKELGVTDVITLAAYVGDTGETILGTATDPESAKALTDHKIPRLRTGAIGGMNGLLAGLAPSYGLRGFCLLATTSGSDPVDLRAASRLLVAVKELLGLEIDVTLLQPPIEESVKLEDQEVDMNYI
jgi:proteasome assembly chaperone (PAC2) family protein